MQLRFRMQHFIRQKWEKWAVVSSQAPPDVGNMQMYTLTFTFTMQNQPSSFHCQLTNNSASGSVQWLIVSRNRLGQQFCSHIETDKKSALILEQHSSNSEPRSEAELACSMPYRHQHSEWGGSSVIILDWQQNQHWFSNNTRATPSLEQKQNWLAQCLIDISIQTGAAVLSSR